MHEAENVSSIEILIGLFYVYPKEPHDNGIKLRKLVHICFELLHHVFVISFKLLSNVFEKSTNCR